MKKTSFAIDSLANNLNQTTIWNKDIWLASELGLELNKHTTLVQLNFSEISQYWLKSISKKFIKINSTSKTLSTLNNYLRSFKLFSFFISNYYPTCNSIETIDRNLIVEFIVFVNSKKYAPKTKGEFLSSLKLLFELVELEQWGKVQPYLIRGDDFPKYYPKVPRYIPNEVIEQLNQNLKLLPDPVRRMILLLQELGLRVGELLNLSFDCLQEDNFGQHYIRLYRKKVKQYALLPISKEISLVIDEQQKYIRKNLGDKFGYLFCGRADHFSKKNFANFTPKPEIMKQEAFTNWLKRLAEKADIKDRSGNRWNFQAHQFRHTVATKMINSGVPQHIIQKYLGHQSPTMTQVYAHIFDETLRQQIEKFHQSKVVNFQGETVKLDKTILSSSEDLKWFKANVQARALEHGYCGRPRQLGDCDISGFDGCYDCPHWRTNKNYLPLLKDTLKRTNQIIEKAQNYGWELQVKKNEPIKQNLEKVIESLEKDNG